MIARTFAFVTLLGATTTGVAQAAAPAGVYTEAQAARGKQTYDRYCAQCHHLTLRGSGHGPALEGKPFLQRWGTRTLGELSTYIGTQMASNLPRGTAPSTFDDLTAHILRGDGRRVGSGRDAGPRRRGRGQARELE
jgi:hypothetical protein